MSVIFNAALEAARRITAVIPGSSDYSCTFYLRNNVACTSGQYKTALLLVNGIGTYTQYIGIYSHTDATERWELTADNGGGASNSGYTVLTVGTWYKVAYVRSGTNNRFYVNGVLIGTAVEDMSATALTELRIGDDTFSESNLEIAYFREWNSALTLTQLNAEWDSSVPAIAAYTDCPLLSDLLDDAGNNRDFVAVGTLSFDSSFTISANTLPSTAIDLGSLPYIDIQDVHSGGFTYEVWYKYTAGVGERFIGLWGFGNLADLYKPRTRIYSDAGVTVIVDTGTSKENRPVQFPVTAGITYYFRFTPNAGNPDPAILELSVELGPDLAVPVGSIAVNDDTEGFPLILLSGTADDTVLNIANSGFPAGEAGDILNNGISLWSDAWNNNLKLYDADFILLGTVAIDVGGEISIRTCNGLNKFYVGRDTNPVVVFMVDSAGAISGTSYSLTANNSMRGLAANNAGTILYFANIGTAVPIKTWDLVGNVAGADLVVALASYDVSDILYLDDDTIIILYFNFAADLLAKRYNTAGVLQNTYNLGTSAYPASTFPRLAYAIDNPNSFWVMSHVSPDITKFRNVKCSDGTILTTRVSVEYETGTFQGTETATPRSRFGNSFSCPFVITRSAVSATGTLIVNKVVLPSGLLNSFDIDAAGGLSPSTFSLTDGNSQSFLNVPAGVGYSITEVTDPDFATTYEVSNDVANDNTNISIAEGEIVTVTITNRQRGSITVGKATNPLDLTTVFNFITNNLPLADFTLLSEEEQLFDDLDPNQTYEIEEFPLPITGQSPTYLVSNGSPIDAITVGPGENVTILVLNQNSAGGIFVLTPGSFNDGIFNGVTVAIPTPFFITAFLGDK